MSDPAQTISVMDWDKHQHYKGKDGPPLWIKLYRDLISNYHVQACMTDHERWVMVGMWCLAARHENQIPADVRYLSAQLGTDVTQADLDTLRAYGFLGLEHGSRASLDSEEKRREEKRREEAAREERTAAAAVGFFLKEVGVEWGLNQSINEWADALGANANYAGVDLPHEIRRCAEWHSQQKKKPKAPANSIHNWLKKAAEDLRKQTNGSRPKTGQPYGRIKVDR